MSITISLETFGKHYPTLLKDLNNFRNGNMNDIGHNKYYHFFSENNKTISRGMCAIWEDKCFTFQDAVIDNELECITIFSKYSFPKLKKAFLPDESLVDEAFSDDDIADYTYNY